jgi:hypothetical protein
MNTLAIIGTAGRREDGDKLTQLHLINMVLAAQHIINLHTITHLVSGGAAWADHTAVLILGLTKTIILPAAPRDLKVCQYYHTRFSHIVGRNTWNEVLECAPQYHGTFNYRNTMVANAATTFLACTFGNKGKCKDGGTADTVRKMQSRGVQGYHLDLHTIKLYPASLL